MTGSGGAAGEDRHWMEQALALGALGEGETSPNPRVGCLLVRDGRPVGSGCHRGAGRPHAEALAVEQAGGRARGATAYVNLEPCAHEGRTPPCADLLAASGVARVVAAIQDPDPRVDGRGFARLREAGVAVEVGLLAAEASRLNDPFLHRQRTGLPLVTIKAALSLDGMISARDGNARWMSGGPARRFAHRLRLRHDAVLVGAGTVRRDDPRLTVRLPGVGRDVLRVILAPTLDVDPKAAMFDRAATGEAMPPRIYAMRSADRTLADRFRGLADVRRVDASGDRLDLRAVLADLAKDGAQSVLVEGGARTIGTFLDAGLADRAALFVAPRLIGARGATPLVDRAAAVAPAAGWRLAEPCQLALADDVLLLGRLEPPAKGD